MGRLLRFVSGGMAAALVLMLALPTGARAQAVDVTGTWILDVQTGQGGGTPTVTFEQDGENLTGHYSSDQLGEADLTGSVQGRDIRFTFDVSVQGMGFTVTYAGTVEGEDAMSGEIDLGGAASGTFTGERQE